MHYNNRIAFLFCICHLTNKYQKYKSVELGDQLGRVVTGNSESEYLSISTSLNLPAYALNLFQGKLLTADISALFQKIHQSGNFDCCGFIGDFL